MLAESLEDGGAACPREVCYRRVKGVHKDDGAEGDTMEAVNDVTDIVPSRDQQCLVGIPFAVILTGCDFIGYSFAAPAPVEQEWRERTLEASTIPSFINKRHRELWPTQEAIFFDYIKEMSFKIPGKAGRSTEGKTKKKKPSASGIHMESHRQLAFSRNHWTIVSRHASTPYSTVPCLTVKKNQTVALSMLTTRSLPSGKLTI